MVSGTAATFAGSVPPFSTGTALWPAAFCSKSVRKEFAGWVRLVGVIDAILFAITAARILTTS
jgi:hypothetical protein